MIPSALVAGAGLRCGQVLGSTTRWGEEPRSKPVHFRDVFATLYHCLGTTSPLHNSPISRAARTTSSATTGHCRSLSGRPLTRSFLLGLGCHLFVAGCVPNDDFPDGIKNRSARRHAACAGDQGLAVASERE